MDINNYSYHVIVKWLMEILQSVRNRIWERNISGSFEFEDSIINAIVPGKKMISLDLTSLFTESICFLHDYIDVNKVKFDVPKHFLEELLLCSTSSVQF